MSDVKDCRIRLPCRICQSAKGRRQTAGERDGSNRQGPYRHVGDLDVSCFKPLASAVSGTFLLWTILLPWKLSS